MISAINIFTVKSPRARENQGISVLKNAIKKKIKVSINDPTKEDVSGATNQVFFLSLSKIWTSNNCATKKAVPDPMAILIDIKSVKLVEDKSVKQIAIATPI